MILLICQCLMLCFRFASGPLQNNSDGTKMPRRILRIRCHFDPIQLHFIPDLTSARPNMDPLSPQNINPSWSNSPTTPIRPLPTSSSSSSSFREPKIFGAPGLGLVSPPAESSTQAVDVSKSSGGDGERAKERVMPYLRLRIGGLDRNRKDLLMRFDASVSWLPLFARQPQASHPSVNQLMVS